MWLTFADCLNIYCTFFCLSENFTRGYKVIISLAVVETLYRKDVSL